MTTTTRRRFMTIAGRAGAAALLGLPARASWAARGAGRLRLVFFADSHVVNDWGAPDAMALAAAAINARRPELVVGGGDLIYDGFEVPAAAAAPQWDLYMDFHRSIRAPVEAVLGNHDLVAVRPGDDSPPSTDPRAVFRDRLGCVRTWRRIDAEGYAIFILDSVELSGNEAGYRGGISSSQIDWLRSELGRTDAATPIVLATHIPLLSAIPQAVNGAAAPAPSYLLVENNREVLSLFSRHNLLLVLQGHLHAEEMLRWRGTTFITSGAICGDKWRGPKHGTREGFGTLTLRPDRIDWDYRSIGWVARRPRE